jgi:hypothetical protein
MANAKVKTAVTPLIRFQGHRHALRIERPACINCRRNLPSLTDRPHHDRGGNATAPGPSSQCRNGRGVAGGHVHLPTPPTTRAVAAPKKVRPRRKTTAATAKH